MHDHWHQRSEIGDARVRSSRDLRFLNAQAIEHKPFGIHTALIDRLSHRATVVMREIHSAVLARPTIHEPHAGIDAPCIFVVPNDGLSVLGYFEEGAGVCSRCLLYTSDAADERSSVDLGGRRIIKKKKKNKYSSADTTYN